MKQILSLVCFYILITANVNAADYSETALNNEASGYVNMLESFIQKATKECLPILKQDDSWRNNLIQDWQQTNEAYLIAVQQWTNLYLTRISNHSGEGVAQYEQQKIKSVIDLRGSNITNEIIAGNTEEKTVACEEFEAKLRNNELDIFEQSPHYVHLNKMIKVYQ